MEQPAVSTTPENVKPIQQQTAITGCLDSLREFLKDRSIVFILLKFLP